MGGETAVREKEGNRFMKKRCMRMLAAVLILALLLDIDVLLCIGMDICGFVVLALISNHYFYS